MFRAHLVLKDYVVKNAEREAHVQAVDFQDSQAIEVGILHYTKFTFSSYVK